MAARSPLGFNDLFGNVRVEPSVSGIILLQTVEPVRPGTFNDLILVSPFRSGAPGKVNRFSSLTALENNHDPDANGDQGVALARTSKAPFADDGMFGSADILTVRPGTPTQATTTLKSTSTNVVTIKTADYGLQANTATRKLTAGTLANSKKLVLADTKRSYTGDNLGPMLSLQYTGNGSAAVANLYRTQGVITYTSQVADEDTIEVNGVTFEFDTPDGVTSGNVAVALGASDDATFANLVTAIIANCPGVTAVQSTAAGTVTVTTLSTDAGVYIVEGTDSGNAFSVANSGDVRVLAVTLTGQSDGSAPLSLPLNNAQFNTIDGLVNFINAQNGYSASVLPTANGFLASNALDPIANDTDVKTAAVTLTAYEEAIVDWVNTSTQGNFIATGAASRLEPDADTAAVAFTGGGIAAIVFADWEAALDLIASEVEFGGILLLDTDDPAVMAATVTFISEQRALGKFFRAYFGLDSHTGEASVNDRIDKWLQVTGALDSTRVRVTCQRMGVFESGGTIRYLHPVFLAAALAGGAAGNLPWVNPLTNKRLRFAGIHDDDSFTREQRERLLSGGVTVVKRENDVTVVALHVTTSRDPVKRMTRIASEVDVVSLIEANVREALLQFRGRWSGSDIGSRVFGVVQRVLDFYAAPAQGALIAGTDEQGAAVPPWRFDDPPFVLEAGVLRLNYQIFIGGELNHISHLGRAEYQRVVGSTGGGSSELSASVQL